MNRFLTASLALALLLVPATAQVTTPLGGVTFGAGPVDGSNNQPVCLYDKPGGQCMPIFTRNGVSHTVVSLVPAEFNVLSYGFVPDGVTDNSAAMTTLNAAIGAAAPGARVLFPCGNYKSTVAMAFTIASARHVSIDGMGAACVNLYFSGANGIKATLSNQFSSLSVSGLSLTTDNSAGAYTAIWLTQAAGLAAPNSEHNVIRDVSIHGYDGYGQANYWGTGVFQDKTSFLDIAGLYFNGKGSLGGTGVKIQGDVANNFFNVVTNISRSNFAYAQYGTYVGTLSQGLTVSGGTNYTGNGYGIYAPAGNTLNDQVSITNSQFGSNATADIEFDSQITGLQVSSNLFIPLGTSVKTAGLVNSTITGNSIQALNAGVGTAFNIGTSSNTAENVTIQGNSCLSIATCATVASGARGLFQGNVVWNTTTPYTNGSANFFQSGNVVNGAQLASQAGSLSGVRYADNVTVNNLLGSQTAPTVFSGFCTSPSIIAANGTWTFRVSVGSSCAASSGIVTMPTAANGWSCSVTSGTSIAMSVPVVDLTASNTTSITIRNYSRTTGASANFTSGDVLMVNCAGQ